MKEKAIENQIKKYLSELDHCVYYKHAASAAMPKGIPDIICCYKGRFIGIEVKREKGGVQSLAQKVWEKNIQDAGGMYILTNNLEKVVTIFTKL